MAITLPTKMNEISAFVDWAGKGYVVAMGLNDALNLIPDPDWQENWYVSNITTATSFDKVIPEFPVAGLAPAAWQITNYSVPSGDTYFAVGCDPNQAAVPAVFSFDLPNHGNGDYTLSIWHGLNSGISASAWEIHVQVSSTGGVGTWSTLVSDTSIGTNELYINTSTGIGNEWEGYQSSNYICKKTFTFTITASTSTQKYYRILYWKKNGFSGTITDFLIQGILLTKNTTHPDHWNAGVQLHHYDDISSYIISADWKLGKSDWQQLMPAEGTANIKLNNSTKRFSPDHATQSVINGGYIYNCRVWIYTPARNNGSYSGAIHYTPRWTGWLKEIKVDAGLYSERTVELRAEQGVFQFSRRNVPPRVVWTLGGWTDTLDAMSYALQYYEPAYARKYARVGISTMDGSFVQSTAEMRVAINRNGIASNLYNDLAGYGFFEPDKPSVQSVVEALVDAEGGNFWLSSFGGFLFLPHGTPAITSGISADITEFEDVEYYYGNDNPTTQINANVVYYDVPAGVHTLGNTDWITVPANSAETIEALWDYNNDHSDNGRSYGTHSTQSIELRRVDDASPVSTGYTLSYGGHIFDERSNGVWAYGVYYVIDNDNAFDIEVRIATEGYGAEITGLEDGYIATDETAALRYGILTKNNDTRYLQTSTDFFSWASKRLEKTAYPRGFYNRVSIHLKDVLPAVVGNDMWARLSWARVGDGILISPDDQATTDTTNDMVINGIEGRFVGQELVFTFDLAPAI